MGGSFNAYPNARKFAVVDLLIFVAKGEIVIIEQFLLLPQRFQFCSIITLLFIELLNLLPPNVFKVVRCKFVPCGKELNIAHLNISHLNIARLNISHSNI